jgi:lysophospholipase L1-like esterase
MYTIQDDDFISNLRQTIALIRSMGTTQITLVPAFYSTLEASHDPTLAGPISRIDQINLLIRQVAQSENVALARMGLEPLYKNNCLRSDLTFDGVHLNDAGKTIYRQFLSNLLNSSSEVRYAPQSP